MSDITLQAKEILEKKIDQYINKYPSALKPIHIQEIMDISQTQTYDSLNDGEMPGAKKN